MHHCGTDPTNLRPHPHPHSENLEKLSKEMRLKRLSGTFKDDDADTLRRAEEEQATPVLGPVGTWLRGFRLVTRNSREENQDGEQQ